MLSRIIDYLFPPECAVCRRLVEHFPSRPDSLPPLLRASARCLCRSCNRLEEYLLLPLRRGEEACRSCAEALLPSEHGVCESCALYPPELTTIRTMFTYAGDVELLLKRYKYRNDRALGSVFGRLIAALACAELARGHLELPDAVIALPSSRRSLQERGYHHIAPLAKEIGRQIGRPVLLSGLKSRGSRSAQALLPPERRIRNMRDAYLPSPKLEPFRGASVLLVDDVVTTGATLNAARSALSAAGIGRVSAITLARSKRYRQHRAAFQAGEIRP